MRKSLYDYCTHCERVRHAHSEYGKCLYQPTSFEVIVCLDCHDLISERTKAHGSLRPQCNSCDAMRSVR